MGGQFFENLERALKEHASEREFNMADHCIHSSNMLIILQAA